jgi:tetratricopeptide (TPR) repeat protein
LIYAGQYEEAREALGELWRGVGRYPETDLYPPEVAAEVLLQCGSLSSCLGSAKAKDTQESTKDLLSKALHLFQSLNNPAKVSEACYELGVCYWRAGAYEEAEDVFYEAAKGADDERRGKIIIGRTLVEIATGRHFEALETLERARSDFENASHALKGRWHVHMAVVLRRLGKIDSAIIEYTAAIYHYEQAGHVRYCGNCLNNLAFLQYKLRTLRRSLRRYRQGAPYLYSTQRYGQDTERTEDAQRIELNSTLCATSESSPVSVVKALFHTFN